MERDIIWTLRRDFFILSFIHFVLIFCFSISLLPAFSSILNILSPLSPLSLLCTHSNHLTLAFLFYCHLGSVASELNSGVNSGVTSLPAGHTWSGWWHTPAVNQPHLEGATIESGWAPINLGSLHDYLLVSQQVSECVLDTVWSLLMAASVFFPEGLWEPEGWGAEQTHLVDAESGPVAEVGVIL